MKLLRLAAGAGAALAGYALLVRPRHLRWGATDDEIDRPMPLDDRIARPTYVTNRAVTIAAGPEDVWPWLAQMGEDPRGGFYSYEWIERLMGMRVHNADHVLAERQDVQPGMVLDRQGNMVVEAVEPGRFLGLGPPEDLSDFDSTWALVLYPQPDGTTRLVSRVRVKLPRSLAGVLWFAVLDPGQLVMERKMLLEIKRRAEATAAADALGGLASLGAEREREEAGVA